MLKKIFILAFIAVNLALFAGCESVDDLTTSAENLRAETLSKISNFKSSVKGAINETKSIYSSLLEKKQQLEETITQINETINSVNMLLGQADDTENTSDLQTEKSELQKTVDDLQATLAEVKQTLAEPNKP